MYLGEFEATVTGVEGNVVYLDRTAFYPTGGGQPSDTGIIVSKGSTYTVVNVEKSGEDVAHTLGNSEGLSIGDEVKGSLDWERRYAHMRYHSAIHVIDGIFAKLHSQEGFLT